jgi:hypothetical protein
VEVRINTTSDILVEQPSPIVCYVHGRPIASFPSKELDDVYLHESNADQHGRRRHATRKQLSLANGVAQRQHAPPAHAHAAVGPRLEIERSKAWK